MKKIVALMIVVATLLCMSSCGNAQHEGTSTSSNNTETQETNDIKDTGSNTQTIEKDEKSLTASLIISRVKAYSAKYDLDPISDLEIKPGEKEEQVITSFRCINGLVSVSVTETNGIVDYIISFCLPSQVIKKVPSDSLAEAAIGAYAYSMIPLFSCEPAIDEDWHQEQFYNAPDEGDSSMVIRSYTSKEWYYTAMVSEAFVTCVAARYCSQCKNNAPKVSFTSGAKICDNCNNSQGGGDTSNSGNTTNGGNTSIGGNKTPYTTTLSGSDEVFKQPSRYSTFVQTIGLSGIYTIVEEAYDDMGNLWGKLKSGIGWVLLSEATISSPRTCPQCGESEPEAIFMEDWQPGDICFGCNYDNFHGGEDSKVYCAQCGADCTYRGLAGDGLCDDCYDSNSSSNNTPDICEHSFTDATCTTPQTCKTCGATAGSAAGHKWKPATCTEPERCTVCGETGAEAYGHSMLFTKCRRSSCDYIDYSCIAGTYTNIGGYGVPDGTTTMVDIDVTNVSVSNSGQLSFTYNGKNYTLTLKQNNKGDVFTAYFDCYLNGVLVENVDFRAGNEMYNNRIYLDGFIIDGCKIYLNATK